MSENWSHKDVANYIFGFFTGVYYSLSNWGFYIFDAEFEDEPELRHKAGVVWVCSLYDLFEGKTRILSKLEERSSELNRPLLVHYCKQIRMLCEATGEVLERFTIEEQIFQQNFRHQLVHSWLWQPHQDSIKVRYFKDGELSHETMEFEEYHSIVRKFHERLGGLEVSLEQLTQKINPLPDKFVYVISEIQKPGALEAVHKEIFEGVETKL